MAASKREPVAQTAGVAVCGFSLGVRSIRKERTPKLRHGARIRPAEDDGERKDADHKTGGPRYLLTVRSLSHRGYPRYPRAGERLAVIFWRAGELHVERIRSRHDPGSRPRANHSPVVHTSRALRCRREPCPAVLHRHARLREGLA